MSEENELSRRSLLGLAGAGLVSMAGAGLSPVYGKSGGRAAHDWGTTFGEEVPLPRRVSAAEKINIALIGCGGQGMANLNTFMNRPDINVVAVCDPDAKRMARAALTVDDKTEKSPEQIKDFRKVLERKDIDAVIVGTPDHWHALPTIYACLQGKDVFCEKPISHNIMEGRRMVDIAEKQKRVIQVGTWQRSQQPFLDAIAYVRSGKLGKINVCRAWKIQAPSAAVQGHESPKAPPAELDYDLWVGPAEFVPTRRTAATTASAGTTTSPRA